MQRGQDGLKVYHSGGWPGFTSYHLRLVDHKLTVIVLRNWYGDTSATQIAERLANVVLHEPPTAKRPPVEAERKQLIGVYQTDKVKPASMARVFDTPTGLALHLTSTNQVPYPLVHIGPLRFALLGAGDGFFARFAVEDGKVVSLTLEQPMGMPTMIYRPTTGLRNGLKTFDMEAAEKIAGRVWLGELPVKKDSKEVLRIAFRLDVQDGVLTGVLDNPDQGRVGVELSQLRLDRDSLAFTWAAIGASYEGSLSDDGKEIVGNWNQGGTKTPLRFRVFTK